MDLHQIIQEVLDLYRSNDLPVEFAVELTAGNAWIDGDVGRLRQLLHNLLKNALEASRDVQHPRITVATRTEFAGGQQRVVLEVRDNGPGFAPEIMDSMFEPYVSTKPRGSGLGLAIVKKIVEEHAGTLSVETLHDGGAQVAIRLLQSGSAARKGGVAGQGIPAGKSGL